MGSSGAVTYKVGKVAPTPDTFSPELVHSPLKDGHASSRTIAVTISDAGDPASGVNTSTSKGVGPHTLLPSHGVRRNCRSVHLGVAGPAHWRQQG